MTLTERLTNTNQWFNYIVLVAIITVIIAAAILLFNKKRIKKIKDNTTSEEIAMRQDGYQCIVCFAIALLFLWFVCAMSFPDYIMRGDVLITIFFFLFIFTIQQIHWIATQRKAALLVLPLLMVICFSQMNTLSRTWMMRTNGNVTAETARAVWDDILEAYTKADQSEEKKAEIHVPLYNRGTNWPIMTSGAYWVSETLYKYGITKSYINASFIADSEINAKYGLPVIE